MNFIQFLFFLCLSSLIYAQPTNFNLSPVGQKSYPSDLNDIWGYVDETGVEYALVGTRTGTSIVSLADPTNPTEVLFIPGDYSVWRDLKTWGDYAYVTADQGDDGLLMINLDPLPQGVPTYSFWKPELTVNASTDTLRRAHNLYIDENGYAYIAGSNINRGENFILDVHTSPGNPIYKGATDGIYAHDAYARGDTLWTSDILNGHFSVYDVSDKTAPQLLAVQNTPKLFCHNAWLSDDGQTLFTTDEKANAWIGAYDVSDLNNITEIDRWKTPNVDRIPHNVHVYNEYLVTSHYTEGLIILDASRPNNMVEVARYDTYGLQPNIGFHGAWGAYPYLPSGLILVSDIETGLHVLNPNYQRACWLEGIATEQGTNVKLIGVEVEILNTQTIKSTGLTGNYKTGYGQAGTYDVRYTKAGYVAQTISVTLQNGQVTTQNVSLVPANQLTFSGQVIEQQTNQAIPFAEVYIESPLYEYRTTADANGQFTFTNIYEDDYVLMAGKWGYLADSLHVSLQDPNNIPQPTIALIPGYRDEFLFDLGWTVSSNVIEGTWERAVPIPVLDGGAVVTPEEDITTDLGAYCFVTENNASGILGVGDVDGGTTVLHSPYFDVQSYSNPYVNYYYFYVKRNPPSVEDSIEFFVTNNLGDTAVLYASNKAQYSWSSRQGFKLKDYITVTDSMQFHVAVNDLGAGTAIEAGVDYFELSEGPLSTAFTSQDNQDLLTCWPNPFREDFTIEYTIQQDIFEVNPYVRIYSIEGREIHRELLPSAKGQQALQVDLQPGVYFVRVGQRVRKIIKQ